MPDQIAQGQDLYQKMLASGAPQQQVDTWRDNTRDQMLKAGAPPEKVDAYWGTTPPTDGSIRKAVNGNMSQVDPANHPQIANNAVDMIKAGLQSSSLGLAVHGMPTTIAPQHAGLMGKILTGAGQFVGDLPATVLGFVVGGAGGTALGSETGPGAAVTGLVGAGAGSAALPTAIRETLIDHYQNEGGASFHDFWSRFYNITKETAKSAVMGAVAAPLGGAAGGKVLSATGSEIMGGTANVATQAATATAVGAGLEGKVPNKDDFITAATLALGFHAAGTITGKVYKPSAREQTVADNLADIYKKTGVPPKEALAQAKQNKAMEAEIFAPNAADGTPALRGFEDIKPGEPEPYVVPKAFHGTASDFENYDPKKAGEATSAADAKAGEATFFSSSPHVASGYATFAANDSGPNLDKGRGEGANVRPAQLQFKNPKIVDWKGDMYSQTKFKQILPAAKAAGHDGVIFNNVHDDVSGGQERSTVYAAFNPAEQATPVHAMDHYLDVVKFAENTAAYAKAKGIEEGDVISKAGAVGRYQITPGTARQYGFDPAKLRDPEYNERAARTILADLSKRYGGNVADMLVAYNAGPGRANSWIRNGRDLSDLPLETQRYLERVERSGAIDLGANARAHDLQLRPQGDDGSWVPPGGKPPEPPEPPEMDIEPPEGSPRKITSDRPKLTEDSMRDKILDIVAPEARETGLPSWLNPRNTVAAFQSELERPRQIDEMLGVNKNELGVEDMVRMVYSSKDTAGYFVRHGTVDALSRDETSTNSFVSAYHAVKEDGGDLAGFTAYRLAARTLEKAKQGIDTGVDKDLAQAYVSKVGAKYKRGAQIMQAAKDASIDYARDSGVFSEKAAQSMKDLNQEHIIFRRVIDPDYKPGSTNRRFNVRTPVKAMTGSNKQITDPVTADVDNIHTIIAMADRNRAIGSFINVVNQDPKVADLLQMEKIVGDIPPSRMQVLDENGKPVPEATQPATENMLAMRGKKVGANEFMYFNNGKPEIWSTKDPDIARLFQSSWPKTDGEFPLITLARKAASFARLGITIPLEYTTRVIGRSQVQASILSPHGGVPFHDFMAGAMDVFNKTEEYKSWVRNGGGGTALTDMDRDYIAQDVQRVFEETGTTNGVWNAVAHPIMALRNLEHQLDAISRVGYKKRVEQSANLSQMKAALESRRAYIDHREGFSRAWVNTWASTVPFMKTSFKDIEQFGRALQERPGKTLLVGAALLTVPTVVNYAVNYLADQDMPEGQKYSDLPRWERDMYFNLPAINGVRVRIPKTYVDSFFFSTLPERFLDAEVKKDPRAFKDWASTMVAQFVPPMTPTIAQPIAEQAMNKTFLTEQPLIPASLEKASGPMQYKQDTTETAKKISQLLGPHALHLADVSPIVLEQYARDWAGTLPMGVLHAMEAPFKPPTHPQTIADVPFVQSFVTRNPGMGAAPIQDFFDAYDQVQSAHRDLKLAIEHQDMSEIKTSASTVRAFINLTNFQKAITNSAAIVTAINKDPNLTNDEKRQRIDQVYGNAVTLAKAGIKLLDQFK